jgi:hypothetical protein
MASFVPLFAVAAPKLATAITTSLVGEAFNSNVSMGFWGVKRQITMRRLLAILTIAGLAMGPLSRPVMAGTTSDAAMADDMSMSATADEMANDMPCCPSKAPAPIDCDKCVFMSACMTKCFAGLSVAAFRPCFAVSGQVAPLQNDSWLDGLGHPPPEYPPRTLV